MQMIRATYSVGLLNFTSFPAIFAFGLVFLVVITELSPRLELEPEVVEVLHVFTSTVRSAQLRSWLIDGESKHMCGRGFIVGITVNVAQKLEPAVHKSCRRRCPTCPEQIHQIWDQRSRMTVACRLPIQGFHRPFECTQKWPRFDHHSSLLFLCPGDKPTLSVDLNGKRECELIDLHAVLIWPIVALKRNFDKPNTR